MLETSGNGSLFELITETFIYIDNKARMAFHL